MKYRFTRNGKTVTNPLGKAAILGGLIVATPVMLLLHKPLQWMGRQGTMIKDEDGRYTISLSRDSFRRRPS